MIQNVSIQICKKAPEYVFNSELDNSLGLWNNEQKIL